MKKTFFVTMLAAALLGGQVFAAIPTKLEGGTKSGTSYYGANKSAAAKDFKVTVSYSVDGEDNSGTDVYGGLSKNSYASGNTISMTGGEVLSLHAGVGKSTSYKNTVTMTGGTAQHVYGGQSTASSSEAYNNTVIVAGDSNITGSISGGYSENGKANDNHVYLVGQGATANIADAMGNTETYTGGAITVNEIRVGNGGRSSLGNTLDIYGMNITVGSIDTSSTQTLNFHISEALVPGEAAMPMITLTSGGFGFSQDQLYFYSDMETDWGEFTDKSITLFSAAQAISGVEDGSEVQIKAEDGAVLATATLALQSEGKSLVMSNIKEAPPVPEPTTGTLSLLALAGLCARRRRK